MNLKPLTVLNDKLQAAIQAENLELADVALDQMKDEVSSLQNRAKAKSWMSQCFNPLNEEFRKLAPLAKGQKS
jgi:hypothetical protein